MKLFSVLILFLTFTHVALATEIGHCNNAELSVVLNASDDAEDWTWVKSTDAETTYFRGDVSMNFDRHACTLSVLGPKGFMLMIDLSKASGDLNLTRNGKPLKDEFRAVTCTLSDNEDIYPRKMQELKRDMLYCQSKAK